MQAYVGFLHIEDNAYAEKISFYRSHIDIISELPLQEKIEIDYYFATAIFETSDYRTFLYVVDPIIENIIESNIFNIGTKDPYKELLFKKGAAYFNLNRLEEAKTILDQIGRMYPASQEISLLHERTYRKIHSKKAVNFRAFCVLLYIISAVIIGIKILVIDSFYNQFSANIELTWQSIFVVASGLLIINEGYIYYKSRIEIKGNNY